MIGTCQRFPAPNADTKLMSMHEYESEFEKRDNAIVVVDNICGYTLKQLGEYFDSHYSKAVQMFFSKN